jgi:hypothetical protein
MKKLLTIPVLLLSVVSLGFSPSLFAEDQAPVTGAVDNTTKAVKDVGEGTLDAAHGLGHGAEDAVKTTGDAVNATGDALKTGGEETGDMMTGGTGE